jgi:hypothetical protein
MVGKSIRRDSSIQRPYTTNPNSNPAVAGRPDITIHLLGSSAEFVGKRI